MKNPTPKPRAVLYYFHDPMCSWCWGYRPVWQQLKAALPPEIEVQNIVGGLAPDTDEPMPPELQGQIQNHWRRIEQMLGTEFNYDFWTKNQPRRATYKACRAVLTARKQGFEEEMIEAIQRGYYLRAMNPSETEVLALLAGELGLNEGQFRNDLESTETHKLLNEQITFARSSDIAGFPSLVLEYDRKAVPIPTNYQDYRPTLAAIATTLDKG